MSRTLALATWVTLVTLAWLGVQAAPAAAEDEDTVAAEAPLPPDRVRDLSVGIGGPDTLVLRWPEPPDNGEPITAYDVQRSDNREQWIDLTSFGRFTGLRDYRLTLGQRYWYRVRAVSDAGPGEWSIPAQGTPAAPPEAITDLAVTSATEEALIIQWSTPAENGAPVSRYELQRLFGSDHRLVVDLWAFTEWPKESTTFSFAIANPFDEPGQAYRVRSWNLAGDSEWSEPVVASEEVGLPARPPSLTILGIAPREVRLRWVAPDANGSPIFLQQVERRHAIDHFLGYDYFSEVALVSGKTSTTIEVVHHGPARTFRVRAWNFAGEGEWSPWAGIRPGLITFSGSHEDFRAILGAQCPGGIIAWGTVVDEAGEARWIPYGVAPNGIPSPRNVDFEAAFPGGFDVAPLRVDYCGRPTYFEPHVRSSAETLTIYTGGIERLRHALETECAAGAVAVANGRHEWDGTFVTLDPAADAEANAGFIDSFKFDRLWQEPLIIRGCGP